MADLPNVKAEAALEIIQQDLQLRRQRALVVTFIVMMFLVSAFSIIFARDVANIFPNYYSAGSMSYADLLDSRTTTVRIISILAVISGLGLSTYLYATGTRLKEITDAGARESGVRLETLATMVGVVKEAADQIRDNRVITDVDRNLIQADILALVKSTVTEEPLSKIDEKYGKAVKNEKISSYIEENLQLTKQRLSSFRDDLSRKASAALAWGLTTAASGIIILLSFVFIFSIPDNVSPFREIFYYTSRLSIVGIIEVVAFFFLNQYRSTLADTKYISNEITNIDLKLLSLIVATKSDAPQTSAISKILQELAKTERNFALKKGETSIFREGLSVDHLPENFTQVVEQLPITPPRSRTRPSKNRVGDRTNDPGRNSLRLLPSGPDRVGEGPVRRRPPTPLYQVHGCARQVSR
jgi:hypothetical protein